MRDPLIPAVLSILLLAGAARAAPDGSPPGTGWTPDQNVLGYVEQSDELTQLLSLLKLAGLTDALKGPGPVTLLAPTNEAFGGMPPEMIRDLQLPRNKAQLAQILGCHVVTGGVLIDPLLRGKAGGKPMPLTTASGCRLTVRAVQDGLEIDDENGIKAAVIHSDVKEANGVVQVIDGVLTPGISKAK